MHIPIFDSIIYGFFHSYYVTLNWIILVQILFEIVVFLKADYYFHI